MTRLAIVLLDKVFDSAFAITHDVLRLGVEMARKELSVPSYTLELISVGGGSVVTGSEQRIRVNGNLDSANEADLIIFPGLELFDGQSMQMYLSKKKTQDTIRWLRTRHQKGSCLAASCTSTFLLAEAGLLDNRLATTSWWLAPEFKKRYPRVQLQLEMMVTQEESLICGGAAMAHLDLALALLMRVAGPSLSDAVAQFLLLDGRDSKARFSISHFLGRNNDETRQAEIWIRQHLEKPMSVAHVAKAVGVSARTLTRRIVEATGFAPNQFIQQIRVGRAIQLLETSNLQFELIAEKIGYADPANLRRLIRKYTGKSPTTIRSRRPTISKNLS